MAPKTRRSVRLKEKEDSKGIEEKVEPEKLEEEGEEDEEEAMDLEGLVAQTYEFMVSKAQHSKRKEMEKERDEREKPDSVSVDITDVIKMSSSREQTQLSSELQPGVQSTDLYLNLDRPTTKSLHNAVCPKPMKCDLDKLMAKSVITPDFEKHHTAPPMYKSFSTRKKERQQAKEQSAGPKWFNLPATTITPEIERDLKLLKLRNVLDPKRHYRKNDSKELPKYFQIGTIVEGAADFYSSRIPKRDRRNNIVNELLADTDFRRYNKKKFQEIQAAKQSGRKGFYKKKMNRRKPNWARH
ncbi:deoxynucleotidyltransferase terminal-interacting protein 2-like [Actinia tenebrosa]|uniref:Deoxynucleotidyltransferase terminal-interacting protein 2-like n=1 Tax=Actinia tenebrosa TaxID=6105 RepID=A0A6P8IVT6_ACTTE|nr:deoxynucleotidyltransferase terminal-interacting protein 2-like [Actinia tenebrosa]